jgi:hypothetical protein
MSDAEIRRRKKVQGYVSRTTGALGLASLGAFGASKIPGSARAVRLVPKAKKINQKKAENWALGTSTAGAGIGGAGSFNFASYTAAEGRKMKPVAKIDFSKVGNWKTIDQREQSQRRSRKAMRAAGAGFGIGAGALALGVKRGGADEVLRTTKFVGGNLKRVAQAKGPVREKIKIGTANTAYAARANPDAALAAGGAGLAGGSVALGAGAKGHHTYQQHKINQRRRSNAKKKVSKSYDLEFPQFTDGVAKRYQDELDGLHEARD